MSTTTLIELVAAILIGIDKSLLPGAGILGVALVATEIPAKHATGLTLLFVIAGDWSAIWAYRENVDRHALARLLPNVVLGVLLGAGFLFVASDTVTRRTIGAILVVFISVNFVLIHQRRRAAQGTDADAVTAGGQAGPPAEPRSQGRARVYGALAGFTTMDANAGGPVTSFYFLAEGFSVLRFLGTTAWFYLIINLIKLPFSVGLGMITTHTLVTALPMVPVIVVTVLVGRRLARRINRELFTLLIYILTVVTAIDLLL